VEVGVVDRQVEAVVVDRQVEAVVVDRPAAVVVDHPVEADCQVESTAAPIRLLDQQRVSRPAPQYPHTSVVLRPVMRHMAQIVDCSPAQKLRVRLPDQTENLGIP